MFLTSVWATWEEWNSAFRTLFPHVKFYSPYGDQVKWYWKGSVRMSAVLPRRNTLGYRETEGTHRNRELNDGKSLLAARARLNAVAQWHIIVGGNIHGWNLVVMKTWKAYQGCLRIRCWTHDSWSLNPLPNHHKPPAKKLSTGEPRIWLNLQNWFGENTSDYQIMHGQNRTGMFIFCVWLSSALHGLKVTDWHAQE